MSKDIVFIADFYVEQVLGGGELNNKELYDILSDRGHKIKKIRSHEVDMPFLRDNKNSFFIVFNFVNLKYDCRGFMSDLRYAIYEHDHKYIKSRNPATYKDFRAPSRDIVNYHFYKNAEKVYCQSEFHKNIVHLNLGLNNIESLGGNLWSLKSLEAMRQISHKKKEPICSIMDSNISHKNTSASIKYCVSNGLEYSLVKNDNYLSFLEDLGANKKFVFLPKTPETLSRVIVEARMMGMQVATNSLIGATSEDWFALKGEELIDVMLHKRSEIVENIEALIAQPINEEKKKPIVSLLSTFCEGEKYLPHFLENITKQTVFEKCELIIIDANSQGSEKELIEKYMEKHDNIVYRRLEDKALPTPCINMSIKMAKGKYLSLSLIDDVKSADNIEVLLKEIEDEGVCLVYGATLETAIANETIEINSSNGATLESSKYNFSKENMIKCLPGPMPLWKKEIHDICGFFDDDGCNFADDWDMWLRAVQSGCSFKKVDRIVGLYLKGGRSQQENNLEQKKEEARIFYKYSHIFGRNFKKYNPYFQQFSQEKD